jgi:hypothetical protein
MIAKTKAIHSTLIAPCGMNCRLCLAYTRDNNACPGCWGDDSIKSKTRVRCRIRNCENIIKGRAKYCFSCQSFPCSRLQHLDKRYRANYGMSMIANLESIKSAGIRHFIADEKERWACTKCGELICVHKPQCLSCGHMWR